MNDKPYKLCICGNPTPLHRNKCARCGLQFNTGSAFHEPSGKNNPQNTMIITDGVIEFDSTKEKK